MIHRTPLQAIIDVLNSAEVKSPFTHDEIAQYILRAFEACGHRLIEAEPDVADED
jgi:hypothetical protein